MASPATKPQEVLEPPADSLPQEERFALDPARIAPMREVGPVVLNPLDYLHESDSQTLERLAPSNASYDPMYGAIFMRFMERGLSLRACTAKLGFSWPRVIQWKNESELAAHHFDIAEGLRVFTLESRAMNPKITASQANVLLRQLARANPEDWGEKIENQTAITVDANLHAVFESIVSRVVTELAETAEQSAYEGECVEIGRDSGEVRVIERFEPETANIPYTDNVKVK